MSRFLYPKLEGEIKMAKTIDEKILAAQEKATQSQNVLKQLLHQKKEEDQKAQTRRLIELGTIVKGLVGELDGVTNKEIKEVLAIALTCDEARKALLALRTRRATKSAEATDTRPEDGA